MVDVSIVNETSPEANWNRQAGRQAGRQTGRQADRQAGGLTNLGVGRHAPPKRIVMCESCLNQDTRGSCL